MTESTTFNTEHVFTAKATISDPIVVGQSKRGLRRLIPITGGTFEGPNIKGDVLPGGADWQLVRPDGDLELYARYLLKTNDGVVIQIIDQALIHTPDPTRPVDTYVRTVIDFEAPTASKYDYLNHAQFLGMLKPLKLKPGEFPDHVIVSVYQLL